MNVDEIIRHSKEWRLGDGKHRPGSLPDTSGALVFSALQNIFKRIGSGEHIRTPHGIARVWPEPGKEPAPKGPPVLVLPQQ